MTNEDYGRHVDNVANSEEARELLKSVAAMADIYFSFLSQRGCFVGAVTITNSAIKKDSAAVITKYTDTASLDRGDSLATRH